MTHPTWDRQSSMKTGEEREGGKSQGGMDIIFKLSIKAQGGIQNLALKVGYVIRTKDQYIERAARVITSEVLKLSPCSIVRGSTDICSSQTKKVSYQYPLHNSYRTPGWLIHRKTCQQHYTMYNMAHVHCIWKTSSHVQDRFNVKDIRGTDGSHRNGWVQNAYNYDLCWLQLWFKFLSNCINELLSIEIVLPCDSVIQYRPCQAPRRD